MHPSRAFVLYNLLIGLANCAMVGAYVPFLLSIGMKLSDVTLVNVVFWAVILALEVPTGLFADRLSRRLSVSCGAAATSLGFLLYAGVSGFWTALLAEVVVGIGSSFVSGALSAWVTDAMHQRGEGDKLPRVFATGALANSSALVAGGFASCFFIAGSHPRACWLIGSAFAAAGFLATRFAMREEGNPVTKASVGRSWRDSVGALRGSHSLKWTTAAGMAMGLVVPFNLYWAPLVKLRSGSSSMAWAWVAMYGSMAAANWAMRRAHRRVAGRETAIVPAALLAVGIGIAGLGRTAGLLPLLGLFMVHEAGRGFFAPALEAFTQKNTQEHYRATYASLQSLLGKLFYVGALAFATAFTSGQEATPAAITATLFACGMAIIAAAGLLWAFRPKAAQG